MLQNIELTGTSLFTLVAPYYHQRSRGYCQIVSNQSLPHGKTYSNFYSDGGLDDPDSDLQANVTIYKDLYHIFSDMRAAKPE